MIWERTLAASSWLVLSSFALKRSEMHVITTRYVSFCFDFPDCENLKIFEITSNIFPYFCRSSIKGLTEHYLCVIKISDHGGGAGVGGVFRGARAGSED